MKLLNEVNRDAAYHSWINTVRKLFPNAQVVGNSYQAQMTDWSSKNNEVAGDWADGEGVVYEPGSSGKKVAQRIK